MWDAPRSIGKVGPIKSNMFFVASFLLGLSIFFFIQGARKGDLMGLYAGLAFLVAAFGTALVSYIALGIISPDL